MPQGPFKFRRFLVIAYLVLVHFLLAFLLGREALRYAKIPGGIDVKSNGTETSEAPVPPPVPTKTQVPVDPPSNTYPNPQKDGELKLIVPVSGVSVTALTDTYNDVRGDRTHQALDIPAPAGTPVLAAADGEIARFFDSVPGGITIYQWTSDKSHILYYAHLQSRADGLAPGSPVIQGQTIGYVGDSGNAGAGNFHLHFSVSRVTDPNRYWEGSYIDPLPLIRKPSP